MTDVNSGPGWYEVIHPSAATTHIVHVYEDGALYFPEGWHVLDRHEFEFAAARGNAHRLVRADLTNDAQSRLRSIRDAISSRHVYVNIGQLRDEVRASLEGERPLAGDDDE